MALGKTIKQRRTSLGMTLEDLHRQTGISKPYLSTIENGRVNNPPQDVQLTKLERAMSMAPGALTAIAQLERTPAAVRAKLEQTSSDREKAVATLRRIVDAVQRGASAEQALSRSDDTLKALLDQDGTQDAAPVPAVRRIPIINRMAAGYPTDFTDLDYPPGVADAYVACPDLNDPHAFAARVHGDSMEPKFYQGDIVVFSPAAPVQEGDDCFVRFVEPHASTFKRVFFEKENRVRLQPRNEQYPPQLVAATTIGGIYKAVWRFEDLNRSGA